VVDLLAALFNGSRDGLEVGEIDAPRKLQQVPARRSCGRSQPSREIQYLLLAGIVQAIDLFDDLILDGLAHPESNSRRPLCACQGL